MQHTKYLIAGGGMAAAAAVKGIRDVDVDGSITVISAETDPPYKRPQLSKDLWHGKPLEKVWIKLDKFGADLHLGRTLTWLNLQTRTAVDDRGDSWSFEKLLLATGVKPRHLPNGGEKAIHFRSLSDYRRLRELAEHSRQIGIVGGGFIGSELAASLTMNEVPVTLIMKGQGIGDRMFPADLSAFLTDHYRSKGITLLTGEEYVAMEEQGEQILLKTRSVADHTPRELVFDGVVAGIGAEPVVELAASAGINTSNGIPVDEYLRTSCPDVFAAGDVVSIWQPELGAWRRVEHENNANHMGRHAGRAMAGDMQPYQFLPFFYSDLFEFGYEAVGEIDAILEMISDWKDPLREGIIYYLRDGVVRGVLLWNVWNQVDNARALISSQSLLNDDNRLHPEPAAV